MSHLIDQEAQRRIAHRIDIAVASVLGEIASHGGEEGLTSALGHAVMRQSFETHNLRVDFRYRQHHKITEERHSGADGGFLVRVTTPEKSVEKVALFQAKWLRGVDAVRSLKMSKSDSGRLSKQAKSMLSYTEEAVAMFYTWKDIYVVDAANYRADPLSSQAPLSESHRLVSLGTYLGSWLPRCTKGDERPEIVTRARHINGFRHGLSLEIVSSQSAVPWSPDSGEDAWRQSGRKQF